jgi:glycyl-tRNA synthetase beta chain
VPREVVVTAMRSHQRYFAVEDASGRLLPHFLVVCDGEWAEPAAVVAGNERVLRARLEDARFYWEVDLRHGLDRLAESLGTVVWLEPVGSVRDKAERVAELVDRLGRGWYGEEWTARRETALRAARLAKADLAGEMIKDGKEFTGLRDHGYTPGVRQPRGSVARSASSTCRAAADPLPVSVEGMLLALADRLDTIAGCWAAGFVPSGSQDPYALRRAGNGVVRMLLEKELHLSLASVLEETVGRLPEASRREGLTTDLTDFFRDRTAYFLRERGITYDVVDAVLAADADDPLARAGALNAIRGEGGTERLVIG